MAPTPNEGSPIPTEPAAPASLDDSIVISGMSALMPGCHGLDEFTEKLYNMIPYNSAFRSSDYNRNPGLDVNSFCNLIHNAFPSSVQDGKFILIEPEDQTGYSDTQVPIAIAPPAGFIPGLGIPKLKIPQLRLPALDIPKLKEHSGSRYKPPRVGSPMISTSVMRVGEDSSAERMEKFKKGVQKMLRVVKVLGQIDQYLSERTRIIVDKLTKTFAE